MKNGPGASITAGATLETVRRRLARWRRAPDSGRRIPAALWDAAAAVAREEGVSRTSRELGLDYYALEKRVRLASEPTAGSGFVEVAWPAAVTGSEWRVEIADERGVRLSVELRGAARAEVESLACTLWSAAR
jgi:hypothetical protein